jgi:hypothetical protein
VVNGGVPMWAYGAMNLGVSVRLDRSFRFVVALRPAISDRSRDGAKEAVDERAFLPEGGLGVMVRAPGAVRASLALLGRFAGTVSTSPGGGFLAGPALRLAFDFPFGRASPLALRISADGGVLAGLEMVLIPLRVSAGLVLAVGRPPD